MNELEKLQTRCVSHEIRNHISICEMYSEIIKKHLQKDGYENIAVSNAVECIQKSLRIISSTLIDLKSINQFEPKVADIKFLLEEAIKLSYAYTIGKNIELKGDIDSAKVLVDEIKFVSCIVNIIKNGIEAIEKSGYIELKTDVRNGNIHIYITNNGKQIPKGKIEEIFEQGYTTKPSGNGLGLHICKQNLKAQNSDLKLLRSDKEKTVFEVTVPTVN